MLYIYYLSFLLIKYVEIFKIICRYDWDQSYMQSYYNLFYSVRTAANGELLYFVD